MENIKTKYGNLEINIECYKKLLIDKIFKILPMKEKNSITLDQYMESFLIELVGGEKVIIKFSNNPYFLSIINSIEGLRYENDLKAFRSKIFECISLCQKL